MAKYRVYWTETTSCWMDVDEYNLDAKNAERVAQHICNLEDYKTEVHRADPMTDPNSFCARAVKVE